MSLLLSANLPAQASTTLSPFLKYAVPLGSIGVAHVQPPPRTDPRQQDDRGVAAGWKLQSLTDAADAILRSATRLEDEVRKEARYWEQVLAVQDQGWSVCRMPRERRTLAVRYGLLECKRHRSPLIPWFARGS